MIVISDDDLKLLEKRFGPLVRQMGSWNSDGVFSYASVPFVAVEKAAESLCDPTVLKALCRLKQAPERTKTFIEILQLVGPTLVEKIAAAYRECALDLPVSHRYTSAWPAPIAAVEPHAGR